MSNPNLIAKQIVDKNGKLTTVHVSLGKLDENQDTSGERIWATKTPPKIQQTPGVYGFMVSAERFQKGVMLPRKRSGRDITFTDHILIDVPVVTDEDAPVSMKVGDAEYRYFGGKVYTKYADHEGNSPDAEDFFAGTPELDHEYSGRGGDYYAYNPDYADIYNKHADDYIVMDGEVWKSSNEPKYVINTSGYIWGTTLDIKVETDPRYGENTDRIFSANERDLAIAKALELIESQNIKGNQSYGTGQQTDYYYDDAMKQIAELPVIEVLDPEAVGSTFEFPSRVEFKEFKPYDFIRGQEGEVQAAYKEAMTSYRSVLSDTPGATDSDASGASKINWDKLPSDFKDNYQRAVKWALDNDYMV